MDLSPGDLLYYGGVEWLNISDFLGKIKKGLELHAMCFVFRTAVVFLCKERLRQKKKSIMVNGNNYANQINNVLNKKYNVNHCHCLLYFRELEIKALVLRWKSLDIKFWFPSLRFKLDQEDFKMLNLISFGSLFISKAKCKEETKKFTIYQTGKQCLQMFYTQCVF